MTMIPTQSKYPDRAGYLGLDTDRNVLSVMSDGKMKSTSIPEGWVNVKDFGAKGDGIHNDTYAIRNAVEATPPGGTLYFPKSTGYYATLSQPIYIKKSMQIIGDGIGLEGMGSKKTTINGRFIFVHPDVQESDIFNDILGLPHLNFVKIKNIFFNAPQTSVWIQACIVITLDNVETYGPYIPVHINDSYDISILNCNFNWGTTFIETKNPVTHLLIKNSRFISPSNVVITGDKLTNLVFESNLIENLRPTESPIAFNIEGMQNINILNNYFEGIPLGTFSNINNLNILNNYSNYIYNTPKPTSDFITLDNVKKFNISNNTFYSSALFTNFIKATNSEIFEFNNYIAYNMGQINLMDTYSQENFQSVNSLKNISSINRPLNPKKGETIFDTTLNKPIWFNGTNWIDATGTSV